MERSSPILMRISDTTTPEDILQATTKREAQAGIWRERSEEEQGIDQGRTTKSFGRKDCDMAAANPPAGGTAQLVPFLSITEP